MKTVDLDPLRSVEVQDEVDRQDRQVAALTRVVARDAATLLRAMDGTADLDDHQSAVREALRTALQHGPLAKELAAERADEGAVCPECHGSGFKPGATHRFESCGVKTFSPPASCTRCEGSGRIDPFGFGIPTARVARGKNAS